MREVQRVLPGTSEVAALAHDLATLAAALTLDTEGMEAEWLAALPTGTTQPAIDALVVRAQHGLAVARLIRALSRELMERSRGNPAAAEGFALEELLQAIRPIYEGRAADRGLTLVVDAGAPCHVTGDRLLLLRIVLNLVDNAVRHSGGSAIRVSATGAPGHSLFFSVSDDGAARARRSPGDTTGSGAGLGLMRAEVRRAGGTMSPSARRGGGTLVEVTLPWPVAATLVPAAGMESDAPLRLAACRTRPPHRARGERPRRRAPALR